MTMQTKMRKWLQHTQHDVRTPRVKLDGPSGIRTRSISRSYSLALRRLVKSLQNIFNSRVGPKLLVSDDPFLDWSQVSVSSKLTLSVQSSFCLLSRFWHILALVRPSTCQGVCTKCGTLGQCGGVVVLLCTNYYCVCVCTLYNIYTSVRLIGDVTCEVKSLCVNRLLSTVDILCEQ